MTAADTDTFDRIAVMLSTRLRAAYPDGGRPDWTTAERVLTALLNGAEVREEWGCRLTWDDGHVEDSWRGSREAAQPMFDLHQRKRANNPGWRVTPTLIRRLHLTLAAETVDER